MLRGLFVLNSIVAIIFGVAFVLVTDALLQLYDVHLDAAGLYVGQLFGGALIGYAILTWLVQNEADSSARRAILLMLFVVDVIGFILSLIAQLNNVVNALGWSTVVIYAILGLGFGYFRFLYSEPETAAA